MASRYPITSYVDYCYHPIHVYDKDLDKDIIVPCGKCDGCLLHNANDWAMRCGMEIEDTPATIFFTLTYNNKYLPKLYPVVGNFFHRSTVGYDSLKVDFSRHMDSIVWISNHRENVRFNSVCDVPRQDNIIIKGNYLPIDISKWDNFERPAINYASKRDVQLWLKLLRKDLYDKGYFIKKEYEKRGIFRYFIISEIGPTTFRGHFHGLLFCQSQEVASYLLERSLYKNWQMCDESKFSDYAHLCDSGARGYVTQYLTCTSRLPKVYRENKEIRPFRLASKSPAIGFVSQDKEKIFEDVSKGVIKYSRPVRRLESDSLLRYPSNYLSSLFPKCYRFNKADDRRRFFIYSYLYRAVREFGQCLTLLLPRLREIMHSQDYLATCACFRFCKENINSPEYYYYLLDNYYYQVAMDNLREFYQSQQKCDFVSSPMSIFEYYPNIEVLCTSDDYKGFDIRCLDMLKVYGFKPNDLVNNKDFFLEVREFLLKKNALYFKDVEDIVDNMVKMPKYNELTGNSPTIV